MGTTRIWSARRPATRAALARQRCVNSVTYSVPAPKSSPSLSTRAATTAVSVAIDPPVVSRPAPVAGSPNSPTSHRSVLSSSATRPGAKAANPE